MRASDYSNCKTLQECFEIREKLCLENNPDEGVRDKMLIKYANGCKTVKEIGVFQGTTFAMLLTRPSVEEAIGVDINFDTYKKTMKHLIDEYAEENGKKVSIIEKSSLDPSTVSECDFLHIDSLHTPSHLRKELKLHHKSVSKYIAFHDVNQKDRELFKVVKEFVDNSKGEWVIVDDHDKGKCGCTIIERQF